jgi:poly-gamma-glutamate synthesis protein (capsule biosynthesis protein)
MTKRVLIFNTLFITAFGGVRSVFSKICSGRRLFVITQKSGILLIFLLVALTANCGDSYVPFPPGQSRAKTIARPPAKEDLPKETRARFIAVGDIMLSRGVNRAIERAGNPLLPFGALGNLLTATDFNFGNLESPVSGNDKIQGRGLVFNTKRNDTAGLIKYNFKIVSLANNHALDQGVKGLRFTQKFLDERQIEYIGVGETKRQAWQPKIITANGIRIGFIGASYCSINDGGGVRNEFVARVEEIEYLRASIEKLKAESDFIVVTMHAGVEYTRKPARAQIAFARAAIDAGADLVIGSHPHWIQTFEQYRGRYVFYSLGNFIFDQRKPDTKEGLMLQITLLQRKFEKKATENRIEKIELIPVVSERLGVPRRASDTETKTILKKIGAREEIILPDEK